MIQELRDVLPLSPVNNPHGFRNYYGVRLPLLRNIAKKIVKEKRDFIPLVDNWSVSDSVCQSMKFARKYLNEVFEFLTSMKIKFLII